MQELIDKYNQLYDDYKELLIKYILLKKDIQMIRSFYEEYN